MKSFLSSMLDVHQTSLSVTAKSAAKSVGTESFPNIQISQSDNMLGLFYTNKHSHDKIKNKKGGNIYALTRTKNA